MLSQNKIQQSRITQIIISDPSSVCPESVDRSSFQELGYTEHCPVEDGPSVWVGDNSHKPVTPRDPRALPSYRWLALGQPWRTPGPPVPGSAALILDIRELRFRRSLPARTHAHGTGGQSAPHLRLMRPGAFSPGFHKHH